MSVHKYACSSIRLHLFPSCHTKLCCCSHCLLHLYRSWQQSVVITTITFKSEGVQVHSYLVTKETQERPHIFDIVWTVYHFEIYL